MRPKKHWLIKGEVLVKLTHMGDMLDLHVVGLYANVLYQHVNKKAFNP